MACSHGLHKSEDGNQSMSDLHIGELDALANTIQDHSKSLKESELEWKQLVLKLAKIDSMIELVTSRVKDLGEYLQHKGVDIVREEGLQQQYKEGSQLQGKEDSQLQDKEDSLLQHKEGLQQQCEESSQQQYEELTVNPYVEGDFCVSSFNMPKIKRVLRKGKEWTSPSFYTHAEGYKICLIARGQVIGSGKVALLISLFATSGEYDHNLPWPAKYRFTLEIMNKQGGVNLIFRGDNNKWSCPQENYIPLLFGKDSQVPQEYIIVNDQELTDCIERDSLEFKVSMCPSKKMKRSNHMSEDSTKIAKPKHQNQEVAAIKHEHKEDRVIGRFMMMYTKEIFDEHMEWKSPSVYTNHHGYSVCLGVRADKESGIMGKKFIALNLYGVPCEFDNHQKWPAEFNFKVEIVSHSDGKNLVFKTGKNIWRRPSDYLPLRFYGYDSNSVVVKHNIARKLVKDDMLEFRISILHPN